MSKSEERGEAASDFKAFGRNKKNTEWVGSQAMRAKSSAIAPVQAADTGGAIINRTIRLRNAGDLCQLLGLGVL